MPAKTFAYVSCAEDGEIRIYTVDADGTLQARGAAKAEKTLGPLAVSPDKRWLVGAARTDPWKLHCYGIDRDTGALTSLGTAPLAASLPYIVFDKTGRWLLGASYGAHLVSVNPVGADGRVGKPQQVIPTARNAHAIITDRSNRYVFVPHLGTDQVFQFRFDEKTGRLAASTPPVLQLGKGTGPRHLVQSPDGRFIYLLNELTASVTTLALDPDGLLTELHSVSALPPDIKLGPGAPRPNDRDKEKDIWASDIHVTPDGRFVYAAERTSSTINLLSAERDGRLTYRSSTPTEKQPRGFRLDPAGRVMIVTGEKSDTISSYSVDPSSGALKLVGKYPTGKGANWVEIVVF